MTGAPAAAWLVLVERAPFMGALEGRIPRDPWVGEALEKACEGATVGFLERGRLVSLARVVRGKVVGLGGPDADTRRNVSDRTRG